MCRVINLADYKNKRDKDIQELIRIVKSYSFNNKDLEEDCNYYLEQYLQKINS
ncbi:hypothetical protein [Clostridium botulinum]|uniref:Uncharacterized protein n=2 Tax=Clostridium botulinum TaxID=1491 RepID=C1FP91_CLOBJ|nr:hypothetical protein [Clostridium botulinum]ACO84964.1 conserved hypothetical protein [Clostridium botulinum A2 str. Kyoto]EDT84577.1 hypothetical protein CBB_1698 [Clostridium botulinum Bf]MBY6878123.1 hypothetical protein [Clostridium botulinum]MBY6881438.1 hypothetical protein [Clostridium botulinum]MBY6892914.1 hypothetical protein [Clostridium botulinum]